MALVLFGAPDYSLCLHANKCLKPALSTHMSVALEVFFVVLLTATIDITLYVTANVAGWFIC